MPSTCTNTNNAIVREVTINVDFTTSDSVTTVNLWLYKDDLTNNGEYLDTENFRYALTTSSTDCSSNVVSSGTFKGYDIDDKIEIFNKVYEYDGEINVSETYYLYIWLDAAETDISTAGKSFKIAMTGTCSNFGLDVEVTFDPNGGSFTQLYTSPGEYSFAVPYDGEYQLEVWGAQGGSRDTILGGYGGYSVGTVILNNGTNLYVNVGGQGENKDNSLALGGYNGGGNSYANYVAGENHFYYAGAGGGATHIATSSGLLSTLSSNKNSILIVAGGGGGIGGEADSTIYAGGSAGGYVANAGVDSWNNSGAGGGTQTGAGAGRYVGGFGYGAISDASGGGGAGYYGGSTGTYGSGGGGSGYIGNSLLTNKAMYCYNCDTSSEVDTLTYSVTDVSENPVTNYAKSGAGAAKITMLNASSKTILLNSKYDEMPIPFAPSGYTFLGWNTKSDGSGTYVTGSSSLVSQTNHTLYAIWKGSSIPTFTYSGDYEVVDDDNNVITNIASYEGNWKIRFLSDGNLVFTNLNDVEDVDIFVVGGGGSGASGSTFIGGGSRGGGGGGGGAAVTAFGFTIATSTTYNIDVGAASSNSSFKQNGTEYFTALSGSNSSSPYFDYAWYVPVGAGGTGRKSGQTDNYGASNVVAVAGASGGGNGNYEFNGTSGLRYGAGGGAGGWGAATTTGGVGGTGGSGGADGGGNGGTGSSASCDGGQDGAAGSNNTGSGGGGGGAACGTQSNTYSGVGSGAAGGTGIVIIRNAR